MTQPLANPYAVPGQVPTPYGAPGQVATVSPTMKPSFKGLKTGGGGTPVGEVVGQVAGWSQDPDNYGNIKFKLHLIQCQVLRSDTPWPYQEVMIEIRISDAAGSGWGLFGKSAAAAFGLDMESFDVDMLNNQWLHLVREDSHSYGTTQQGQAMAGAVWHVHQVMVAGQQALSVSPQYNQPATPSVNGVQGVSGQGLSTPQQMGQMTPGMVVAPPAGVVATPMVTPPIAVATPVVAAPVPAVIPPQQFPAPTQPAALPVVETPVATPTIPVVTPSVTEVPTVTTLAPPQTVITPDVPASTDPAERAKQLLHGNTLAEFYQKAIPDATVRLDANITNGIMNNTLVESWKQQGLVTLDSQGKHSVVGM